MFFVKLHRTVFTKVSVCLQINGKQNTTSSNGNKIIHIGLGAKLIYMGYFASLLHPPGRKTWLLFSVRDMSWELRNPCFTKISMVSFL